MAAQLQAAKSELLRHMHGLPTALQGVWWTTNEGKQVYRRLEEAYRQLANDMAEERGRFLAAYPDTGIAQTSPSSSLRGEMVEGEATAGQAESLEEVTGEDGFCGHARTPRCVFQALPCLA